MARVRTLPPSGSLVAENAVIQQGIGAPVVQAEEGRGAVAAPRSAGLAEINVGGQHGEGDVGANPPRGVEHRRPEAVEAKPAAALPADTFGDAARFAVDDLVQARDAMADGVRAHFDADVAAAHLVRHRRSGAGAEKGIEDEVAGVGGDVEDALQEAFGLWRGKRRFSHRKEPCDFLLSPLRVVAYIFDKDQSV